LSAKKTNLVTSCPACVVSFYVTPEQLSAHRGEVRCGKCNHVFNALDRLSDLSATPQAEMVVTEAISQAPLDQPEEIIGPIAPNIADFSVRSASVAAPANPKVVADVTFKTKLGRPGKRKFPVWLLVLLSLVFALLATAQVAYYMRAQVAAQWPVLKPYLVKTCKFLNCTVELSKQIDLLSIDDSDLKEDAERQGLIHFSSTIINNAAIAQAYPLLELTLTDTYDKPVLRHAFTPHEYLPADTDTSKGLAAGEEVHLKLNITASGEPVAGYRVFVTYP
jgi:predicted Zn finger-like uncharacterized protein